MKINRILFAVVLHYYFRYVEVFQEDFVLGLKWIILGLVHWEKEKESNSYFLFENSKMKIY